MAAGAVALPAGFELEAPAGPAPTGLPPGFELEQGPGLAKSAEYGAASGPGGLGDIMARLPKTLQDAMTALGKMGQGIGARGGMANIGAFMQAPTSEQTRGAYSNVTGRDLPPPQSLPERMVAGGASAVTDPVSYLGPGSMGLKTTGAIASGALGEVGQDVAGTPGRIGASLLGGVGAAKTLGPRAVEAAIPTAVEQETARDAAYQGARDAGVKVQASPLIQWAADQERNLTRGSKYAFTGGQYGTAPKALNLLDAVQNTDSRSIIPGSGLDTLRRNINDIAGERVPTEVPGVSKPTPDAKAAMVLKKEYQHFLENLPQHHVVAGDLDAFTENMRVGNASHGALAQTLDAERRINNAVTNYEGGIDVRLDKQLKSQFRPILKNTKAQRGLNQEQIAAVDQLNKGTPLSNTLSQAGRFSGLTPVGAALNFATLGLSGAVTGAAAHAARLGAYREAMAQAQHIRNLAAKRSPLYQQRAANLPQTDLSANPMQLLRSVTLGLR